MNTLSQRTPKAKKEHRCDYCNGTIQVGEVYNYSAHTDGMFYAWKSHLDCQSIAHELNMWEWVDEGLDSDSFQEFIRERYLDDVDDETLSLGHEPPPFADQLLFLTNKYIKNKQS
jgi:hypothetical protein